MPILILIIIHILNYRAKQFLAYLFISSVASDGLAKFASAALKIVKSNSGFYASPSKKITI